MGTCAQRQRSMRLQRHIAIYALLHIRVRIHQATVSNTYTAQLSNVTRFDWSPPSIATSETISNQIDSIISKCSSDYYIVAHQPGASSRDYSPSSTPHLKDLVQKRKMNVKSGASVSDVVGEMDPEVTLRALQKACGAERLPIDPLSWFSFLSCYFVAYISSWIIRYSRKYKAQSHQA